MVKAALRILEDSMCRCGHSMMLTQAPDARAAYRPETLTCPACEAAEGERKRETGAGKITYVKDMRDTPGAMGPDADDIMWFPDDDQVAALDGVRYADTDPAAAMSTPTPTTTAATMPLPDRASEHSSAK